MRRILFAGALTLAAMAQAFAADLPPVASPPPRAPAVYVPTTAPEYNWGGIYVGLNGGYAFGNSEWTPTGLASTGNFNVNGVLAGGTIGANFQSGQFVFGVEADADWTDIKGSLSGTGAAACLGGSATSCTFQTSNDWLGTARLRAGYAFDRVLLYATGGGAFGDVKGTSSGTSSAGALAGGATTSTEFGWTAGAGVEVAMTDNITAKIEYLFVDLSNGSFSCAAAACGTTAAVTAPVSFDASVVRAGLNFKFNPF